MNLPRPIKNIVRTIRGLPTDKHGAEIHYWKTRFSAEGNRLGNDHYRKLMLGIADETDEAFLSNKIVADFGCGPRGSLAWLSGSPAKFGIDVLATRYAEAFPDEIRSHGMIYVTCTETLIPMPSSSVDVMFTINALDHVADLEAMCNEIYRVLKPGGELIASFNLNEPATYEEPQCLTEELLQEMLLNRFEVQMARFGKPQADQYEELYNATSTYVKGDEGYMWYRGVKAG